MKTDKMLYSGGNGTGLSFTVKYAESSSKENPVVIAKGVDENRNEFEQTFNLNDIDMTNASTIEMKALEGHLKLHRECSLSTLKTLSLRFPELKSKGSIWTPAYFVSSSGQASNETIEEYINSQYK